MGTKMPRARWELILRHAREGEHPEPDPSEGWVRKALSA